MVTLILRILVTVFQLLLLMCITTNAQTGPLAKIFSVQSYGAVADGYTDNSNAFLDAWRDACEWNGNSWILIPRGIYMLNRAIFIGPCKGATGLRIEGVIKAPSDPSKISSTNWISFRYVDRLVVEGGGGYLDGQGAFAWEHGCHDYNCRPISMCFDFVTNSRITNLKSVDSKSVHFKLFQCQHILIDHIKILAPGDSPNTDGINVAESQNIQIHHGFIGTGDDCISVLSGTQNLDISDIFCGPGHGISIGSLGRGRTDTVRGVHVRNCSFSGTQNGLRVKTWAPSLPSFASDFVYEDIYMQNADNPIIIDQHYCPNDNCNSQAESAVQINNVTFRNIWGTSSSEVAVNIQCSSKVPCTNFQLQNINLAYNGKGEEAKAECLNVHGQSFGQQQPPACL